MQFPAYLTKNRFGVYYFQLVFPTNLRKIVNKKAIRRSLKTKDRKLAVMMAQEFRRATERLFPLIANRNMDWIETKKILDEVAEKLFQKYVQKVHQVGFDFQDKDSLDHISPEANIFLGSAPDAPYPDYHFNLDKNQFENDYYKSQTVIAFVDSILEEQGVDFDHGSEEYQRICKQALEMLYRLDQQKNRHRQDLTLESSLRSNISQIQTTLDIDSAPANIPTMTLEELITEYINLKVNIEKKWKNPRTAKGNIENLERIKAIFEVVAGRKNFPIFSLTKKHAREVKQVLSIIPNNLKKKHPNLSMKQVITKCRAGEIAKTEKERLKASTYNTYANLITGIFRYAEEEEYVPRSHFQNIRIPKSTDGERTPFTIKELELFFKTDLYTKKDFKAKWSWRFWVPLIMLYSGCRVEEVCQLFLEDIYESGGVLCFHFRDKKDEITGEIIQSIKNSQSNRLVPVHSKLLKIGLLDYIEWLKKNGEKQLFPSLKNRTATGNYKQRNTAVSKWFNENTKDNKTKSYISKSGITDSTKVLYCFRHTVESYLNNHKADIENDKIDALTGHEIKSTGRKHYGGYNPETLKRVVELLDYKKVKFPWNNNKKYSLTPFPWKM